MDDIRIIVGLNVRKTVLMIAIRTLDAVTKPVARLRFMDKDVRNSARPIVGMVNVTDTPELVPVRMDFEATRADARRRMCARNVLQTAPVHGAWVAAGESSAATRVPCSVGDRPALARTAGARTHAWTDTTGPRAPTSALARATPQGAHPSAM